MNILENIENQSNVKTSIISLILILVSIISDIISKVVENYDVYFKVLTLISLTFVVILNLIKIIQTIVRMFKKEKNG